MDTFLSSPSSLHSNDRNDIADVADLERFQMKTLDESGGRYKNDEDDEDDDGGINEALTAQANHIKQRYNVDLVKAGIVPQKSLVANNTKNEKGTYSSSSSSSSSSPSKQQVQQGKSTLTRNLDKNSDFSWDGVKIGGSKGMKLVPPFVGGGGSNPSSINSLVGSRPLGNKTAIINLQNDTVDEVKSIRKSGRNKIKDKNDDNDKEEDEQEQLLSLSKGDVTGRDVSGFRSMSSNDMIQSSSSSIPITKRKKSGYGQDLKDLKNPKDVEIERLEIAINTLTAPISDGDGKNGGLLDARDAKILELVKKSKQLTMQLNRERDRVAKLTIDLAASQAAHSSYEVSGGGLLLKSSKGKNATQGNKMSSTLMTIDDIDLSSSEGGGTISSNALQQMEDRAKALSIQLQKQQRMNERALAELRATHRILIKELGPLQSHPSSSSSSSSSLNKEAIGTLNEQQSATLLLSRALFAHGIQHSIILGDTREGGSLGTDSSPILNNDLGNASSTSSSASVMSIGASSSSSGAQISSIQSFIAGDWKGRQQIITLLRAKVKALERELMKKTTQGQGQGGRGGSEITSFTTPLQPHSNTVSPKMSIRQPSLAIDGAPSDSAFGLGLDNTLDETTETDNNRYSSSDTIQQQQLITGPDTHDRQNFETFNTSSPQGQGKSSSINTLKQQQQQQQPLTGRNSIIPVAPPLVVATTTTGFDVDDRAVAVIAARESSKTAQLSRLNEQLSSSRADAERAKLEASALKARGQILESEMKKFKSHLRSLLSKSETDDRLVEALRLELRSTKGNLEAMTKKAQTAHLHSLPVTSSGSNTLHESDEIAQRTINALKMQISQLRSEIDAVGSTPRPILQQQHFMHQEQQQQQQQIPLSRPLHVYSTSDRDTR
jgi:hypothetical protein